MFLVAEADADGQEELVRGKGERKGRTKRDMITILHLLPTHDMCVCHDATKNIIAQNLSRENDHISIRLLLCKFFMVLFLVFPCSSSYPMRIPHHSPRSCLP